VEASPRQHQLRPAGSGTRRKQRIAIMDQVALAIEQAVHRIREVAPI
jgi:hypothetical protein